MSLNVRFGSDIVAKVAEQMLWNRNLKQSNRDANLACFRSILNQCFAGVLVLGPKELRGPHLSRFRLRAAAFGHGRAH
jgi:hypothetical protein